MGAKIRTWAWLALLLAGVLASAYFVLQSQRELGERGETAPITFLLPASLDEITAVEVIIQGRVHRFERNQDGAWYRHAHAHGSASGAEAHRHEIASDASSRIAEAVTVFSRTRVERTIARLPLVHDAYGTAFPAVIVAIFVKAKVRPAVSIRVGHHTPDGFARYVEVAQLGAVVTIPTYQIARLKDLVASFADPQ